MMPLKKTGIRGRNIGYPPLHITILYLCRVSFLPAFFTPKPEIQLMVLSTYFVPP